MDWKSKPNFNESKLLWCVFRRACKERYDDTCIIHFTN